MNYTVFPRTYKSGRKVWVFQANMDTGETITRKIEDCDIITRKEAKAIGTEMAKEIKRQLLSQKYPDAFIGEQRQRIVSISDLQPEHVADLQASDASVRTIKEYETTYTHLIGAIGDKGVSQVTKEDFNQWRIYMMARMKNVTVNKYHRQTKRIFNFAIEQGYTGKNPWARSRKSDKGFLKEEAKEQKIMPLEDVKTFFRHVQEPLYQLFFGLMYYTGSRPGEILAMERDKVYIDEQIPFFRAPNIKARKVTMKALPIPPALIPLFETVLADFTGTKIFDSIRDTSQVDRKFNRILEKAGLPGKYTPTWLRHSLSTQLQLKGVPLKLVSRILDHSSTEVTEKHYSHMDDIKLFSDALGKMPDPFTDDFTNGDR